MRQVDSISSPYAFRTPLRKLEFQRQITRFIAIAFAVAITLGGSVVIGSTDYGIFFVGGLIGLAVGTLIAMRPEFGLYILLAFIYANVSAILEDSFGVPDTNRYLVALIFIGTLTGRLILERKTFVFRTLEMSVVLLFAVVIVSLLFAEFKEEMLRTVVDWGKDLAILIIAVQLCTDERVYKRGMWVLILTATGLATLSAVQMATGNFQNTFLGFATTPVHEITEGYNTFRPSGPLGDPNFYGMVLAAILPMAIYRFFGEKRIEVRLLAGMCAFLILLGVIFTYSRGAFLALVITGILIVYERKMNIFKVVIAGLVVSVLVFPFLPRGFLDRINTLTGFFSSEETSSVESSFQGRTSEILVGLRMFYDDPLLGKGNGNYELHYLDYSERIGLDLRLENRQAHSLYVEIAAEEGILGIAAFTIMLFFVYNSLRKARADAQALGRDDLVTWIAGVQIGLAAYLFASIFLHGDYFRYFWLLIAFAASSSVMVEQLVITRKEQLRMQRALSVNRQAPRLPAPGADERRALPATTRINPGVR